MGRIFNLLGSADRKEEGVVASGLPIFFASLVLVAFSLAFAVVNGGTFASQRLAQTTMSSLDSVLSTIQVRGSVTAIDANDDGAVDENDRIVFDVANVPGGIAVLVDPTDPAGSLVINYADARERVPGIAYAVSEVRGDGDNLLESGELFEISVQPPSGSTLHANETFNLEIVPPGGGVLTISRTIPPATDRVIDLH